MFTIVKCDYKTKIGFSRRIIIPFEKKQNIDTNKFAVFLIKKSETNLFFSFSFDGFVLFSCSSGSAGLKKKERRRKHASEKIGYKFSKFVRYYYKITSEFTPFRNIIVHLQAPISYFKLFMRSFLSYYRSLFKFFRYRYNGQLIRYKRKAKILIRIYSDVYKRLRFSLYKLQSYKKKVLFNSSTFFFVNKLVHLVRKTYNCNIFLFLKFFFLNSSSSKYLMYMNNFSIFDFFFFFFRQKNLYRSIISNPPKKVIVRCYSE